MAAGYGDGTLRGVGGWLAFFLIAMGIFSPLRIVVQTYQALHGDPELAGMLGDIWPRLLAIEWGLAAVAIAGCGFIVWRLVYVQDWASVRIAIAGIWLMAFGILALEFALLALLTTLPVGEMYEGLAGVETIRSVVFCTVWTAYFLKSERVANTYRPDAEETAEVFA